MKLLILKEKHENVYLSYSSLEELHKIALEVVKSRYKQKWYHAPKKPGNIFIKELTQELMEQLPTATQDSYKKEIVKQKKLLKEYERDNAIWNNILLAIKNNTGLIAWSVLQDRQDYEYEGYEIINLTNKY